MQEEQFWLLVSLKLSGEATPEELAQLEEAIRLHPERMSRIDMLNQLWQAKPQDEHAVKDGQFDKHLQRLSTHLASPVMQYDYAVPGPSPAPARSISRYLKWAAAAAAVITVSTMAWYLASKPGKDTTAVATNVVSTKPGSKSKIQLPDGTQVWLNADSRLTYHENFAGGKREVHLTGEAFFNVVKDKDHPFVIHTSAVDIKVLGTVFNVRSYEDEKNTETSLIRGSVEVTVHNNPGKKIILKPNEKLVVKNDPQPVSFTGNKPVQREDDVPMMTLTQIHLSTDSTTTETGWIKNKLVFDGEPLEIVARKIERWYDVKVEITDETLKQQTYTATFEDESLAQVMHALQISGNFRYTINKKLVTIKP